MCFIDVILMIKLMLAC